MDAETEIPPPESRLIRTARNAAGISAQAAAESTGGTVSAAYWRDVERGHGWRRGKRVPVTGSDRVIAHMARAAGISPGRLETEGERPGAAVILREILGIPAPGAPAPSAAEAFPEPQGDAAWLLFPADASKRRIWRLPEDEETRAGLIRLLDQKRAESARRPQDGGGAATGT